MPKEYIDIQVPPYVKKNMQALKDSNEHLTKKVFETLEIVNAQNARITDLANKFEALEKQRKAEFLNQVGIGATA